MKRDNAVSTRTAQNPLKSLGILGVCELIIPCPMGFSSKSVFISGEGGGRRKLDPEMSPPKFRSEISGSSYPEMHFATENSISPLEFRDISVKCSGISLYFVGGI